MATITNQLFIEFADNAGMYPHQCWAVYFFLNVKVFALNGTKGQRLFVNGSEEVLKEFISTGSSTQPIKIKQNLTSTQIE